MKKTLSKISTWYNQDLLIGALSMLVILLVLEGLFSFPSRFMHTSESHSDRQIEKPVGETGKGGTSLALSESSAFCTKEYRPVCGADGKTYDNACLANTAKTIVANDGECQEATSRDVEKSDSTIIRENPVQNPDTKTQNIIKKEDTASGITSDEYTNTGKYHVYTNTYLGYSFSFPNYAWFSGYGAQSGALHTLAIGLDEPGIANFDTAPVRVWFYKKEPTNPPSRDMLQLENGVLYLSATDNNPKIQKILNDIRASAK